MIVLRTTFLRSKKAGLPAPIVFKDSLHLVPYSSILPFSKRRSYVMSEGVNSDKPYPTFLLVLIVNSLITALHDNFIYFINLRVFKLCFALISSFLVFTTFL